MFYQDRAIHHIGQARDVWWAWDVSAKLTQPEAQELLARLPLALEDQLVWTQVQQHGGQEYGPQLGTHNGFDVTGPAWLWCALWSQARACAHEQFTGYGLGWFRLYPVMVRRVARAIDRVGLDTVEATAQLSPMGSRPDSVLRLLGMHV